MRNIQGRKMGKPKGQANRDKTHQQQCSKQAHDRGICIFKAYGIQEETTKPNDTKRGPEERSLLEGGMKKKHCFFIIDTNFINKRIGSEKKSLAQSPSKDMAQTMRVSELFCKQVIKEKNSIM